MVCLERRNLLNQLVRLLPALRKLLLMFVYLVIALLKEGLQRCHLSLVLLLDVGNVDRVL